MVSVSLHATVFFSCAIHTDCFCFSWVESRFKQLKNAAQNILLLCKVIVSVLLLLIWLISNLSISRLQTNGNWRKRSLQQMFSPMMQWFSSLVQFKVIVVVTHGLKFLYAQECIQTMVVEESGLSNLMSVESMYNFLLLCNSEWLFLLMGWDQILSGSRM
jgi:hypothetical protein